MYNVHFCSVEGHILLSIFASGKYQHFFMVVRFFAGGMSYNMLEFERKCFIQCEYMMVTLKTTYKVRTLCYRTTNVGRKNINFLVYSFDAEEGRKVSGFFFLIL